MNHPETNIHPSVLTGRSVIHLIDSLLHELETARNSKEVNVHHIRVDIKKLRAWLRLMKKVPGSHELKEIDRSLRDTAKQFSLSRDSEIIPETIGWLQKKTDDEEEKEALEIISQYIQHEEHPHPSFEIDSHIISKETLSDLKQKSIKVDIKFLIRHGLKRTCEKAITCGRKAFSEKSAVQELHKLRKQVKYLCYQTEFIMASCPDYCRHEHELLDKLGKQLGKIHDLDILQNYISGLKTAGDCRRSARMVNALIDKQIEKLRKHSKELHREAFSRLSVFQAVDIT